MIDVSIPTQIEDLTPAWLTGALRSSGVIATATVTAAAAQPIGAGAGFIGEIARISLRYDAPESGAPGTLIAKLPTADSQRSLMSNAARLNEREIRFYESVAADSHVRTPRCYYSAMDTERHQYVLLLEDMAPARVGDQVAGCSIADAELAVRTIAPLHAAWWQSDRLEGLDWMPRLAGVHPSVEQWWQSMWERVVERSGGVLSSEMHRLGEQFGHRAMYALQQLDAAPHTLVHGDYHLDNLFFGTDEDGTATLAVADWQLASRGAGMYDVAFFLSGSLDPAERTTHELRLLRVWHDALAGGGVRGYSFDEAVRDYRLATFYCMTSVMLVLTMMDDANPRSVAVYETWLRHVSAAITDLDLGELLPV
jgi:hypothetical protein